MKRFIFSNVRFLFFLSLQTSDWARGLESAEESAETCHPNFEGDIPLQEMTYEGLLPGFHSINLYIKVRTFVLTDLAYHGWTQTWHPDFEPHPLPLGLHYPLRRTMWQKEWLQKATMSFPHSHLRVSTSKQKHGTFLKITLRRSWRHIKWVRIPASLSRWETRLRSSLCEQTTTLLICLLIFSQ